MKGGQTELRIILTGASSGIGLAVAKLLVKSAARYRLMLTAREKSLSRFSEEGWADSDRILLRPLDVTDGAQRAKVVAEAAQRWGGVDALVNNAGISYRSTLEEMSDDEDSEQLRANYIGPMALTRLVLPYMRRQRFGRVINVSSVGGMMAMPTMGSYSASKFALEGASEALWYELKPWNISVTLVQPGFVHSNSFNRVLWSKRAKETSERGGDYFPYYAHMGAFIERLMRLAVATPDKIARHIVRCIEQPNPPLRLPATIDAHIFSTLRRFLPRRIYHWLLYRSLPGITGWGRPEESSARPS